MMDTTNAIREALSKIKSTPFDQATVMPAAYYTSDDFMRLESEYVFRREWVCLGRADELASPGDYYTTELIGEQLLVTLGADGEIRVLSNVCRHRGNMIAAGKGNRSRFTCNYHAWTYDFKGALIGAPLMSEAKNFDLRSCVLPSFRTEIWQGFLFVNLSGDAAPLAPRIRNLIPYIEL